MWNVSWKGRGPGVFRRQVNKTVLRMSWGRRKIDFISEDTEQGVLWGWLFPELKIIGGRGALLISAFQEQRSQIKFNIITQEFLRKKQERRGPRRGNLKKIKSQNFSELRKDIRVQNYEAHRVPHKDKQNKSHT